MGNGPHYVPITPMGFPPWGYRVYNNPVAHLHCCLSFIYFFVLFVVQKAVQIHSPFLICSHFTSYIYIILHHILF